MPTPPAILQSIQVGQPRTYGTPGAADPMDKRWTTAFFKEPVAGPVRVGWANIEGDRQADLRYHGGPDKAVLAYSADHYEHWRTELEQPDLPFGAFGENLTIAGLTESDVCVGDVWEVGEVRFELSQPRRPCWKIARRWRIKGLTRRVLQTGRTGWYYRVVREGMIRPGQDVTLVSRPHPEWTVARANEVMYQRRDNAEATAALADLPELAVSWRDELRGRW